MMLEVAIMFAVTVLQNASFTLVSRARNSGSIGFHAIAAVASNGVWLLVIRRVVTNLDSIPMMFAYVAGGVAGSVLMHYVSMHYLERGRRGVGAK